MAIVGYIRVSSKGQDYEMQRDMIAKRATPTSWYEEKASAKTTDRAELKRLLADVRAGKVAEVWVFKLDRLTRSGVADTFRIVDDLRRGGVTLYSVADNLCIRPGSEDIVSETLVFALSLAAKLERAAINDRVCAARERMASMGEPWGRPPRMTAAELVTARRMAAEGRPVREISQALGVPRSTVGRAIKRPTSEAA